LGGLIREDILAIGDREHVAELRPVQDEEGPRLRDLPGILSNLPHLEREDIDAFEADLMDAFTTALI
jgi:hypothetical protein